MLYALFLCGVDSCAELSEECLKIMFNPYVTWLIKEGKIILFLSGVWRSVVSRVDSPIFHLILCSACQVILFR